MNKDYFCSEQFKIDQENFKIMDKRFLETGDLKKVYINTTGYILGWYYIYTGTPHIDRVIVNQDHTVTTTDGTIIPFILKIKTRNIIF